MMTHDNFSESEISLAIMFRPAGRLQIAPDGQTEQRHTGPAMRGRKQRLPADQIGEAARSAVFSLIMRMTEFHRSVSRTFICSFFRPVARR